MSPEDIIRELGMQPHPEGGWYVQTFRDAAGGERGHSTAIYYLLTGDSVRTGIASMTRRRSGIITPARRSRCIGRKTELQARP